MARTPRRRAPPPESSTRSSRRSWIFVCALQNDSELWIAAPIEVAVWTNEEGSRFAPAMIASGVFAGVFDLDYAHARADVDGKTLGAELAQGREPGPVQLAVRVEDHRIVQRAPVQRMRVGQQGGRA